MKKIILVIATAMLIAGCGGSDSSDDYYKGPFRLSKIEEYRDNAPKALSLYYSYELAYGADNYLSTAVISTSGSATSETAEYSFDDKGNLIKVVTPDETLEYTYDADDNLISNTTDDGNDGEADEAVTYTYDAEGNMTGYTSYDPIGTPDDLVRLSYDAEGTLTTIEYDSEADTIFEEVHALTFNDAGNLTEDVITENGVAYEKRTYTYNADNKLMKIELDSDMDGTTDSYTDYEYDENGNMVRVAYYKGASLTPEREALLTYERGTELGTDIIRMQLYNDLVYKSIFMFGD